MIVQLPYGKENLELSIPDRHFLQTLLPNEVQTDLVGTEEVIRALEHPIGTERLKDLVSPGQKVAIVTSDITRPLPSYLVLPPVLKELNRGGISDSDITIVFALGSHRAHTREEMIHLVGEEVFNRVKCVDSKDDFVHMGTTRRGTPVDIYRDVAEADVRICLGNIEFHYFAGYSGGSKAIMPGVSTRNAIQCNHSRMVQAEAKAGAIEGNPIREDIDEVCERFVPITFIVNVILDEKKRIRRCVAGHFIKAQRGLPLSGSALQNPDSPPGRHRNRFCRRISQGYQSLPGSEGSGQRKACGKGRWLYSLGCLFERGTGRRSF